MGTLKPPDLPAADLFALLCQRRPRWALTERFTDAPDVKLYGVAMTPLEWHDARRGRMAAIRHALWTDDGPVFETEAQAGELRQDEARRLLDAIQAALAVCAPTYGRIDLPAWELRLSEGAQACGSLTAALADCADLAVGMGGYAHVPRLERFWGVPVADVLDGHRLVYAAARRLRDRK